MNDSEEIAELKRLLADRNRIDEEQNRQLNEILFCIKGSAAMNIEGVIPMQKRMEKELHELISWKKEVSLYLGIITSKKLWRWVVRIIVFIAVGFLIAKYGFEKVWGIFKQLK